MTIGPAPTMRMDRISLRLGMRALELGTGTPPDPAHGVRGRHYWHISAECGLLPDASQEGKCEDRGLTIPEGAGPALAARQDKCHAGLFRCEGKGQGMGSRRSFLISSVLAVASVLWLGACAAPQPGPELAPLDFADEPKLRLYVARVVFRDETSREEDPAEVGRYFPTPPRVVEESWAKERLAAVGREGELEAILYDASVRETSLPRTGGLRGLVTRDQSERYDARLVLALRAYDRNGQFLSGVESRIERSTTDRK